MTKHLENTEPSNSTKPVLANRIFKFRAFSNKDKTMYYGRKVELITSSDYVYCRILLNRSVDNPHNEFDMNGVLTQFIGHKDKNGKEIYEGDIIKAKTVDVIHPQDAFKIKDEYVISSVYWDNYNCSFETDFNCFSFSDSKHFEIIGNIFENPELLTQS